MSSASGGGPPATDPWRSALCAGGDPTPGCADRAPVAVLRVVGPLTPADIARLCEEARALLTDVEPGAPVECDVRALGTPDVVALDALARLQLTARRLGHQPRLRGASPALRAILVDTGLCEAVPLVGDAAPSTSVRRPDVR